MNLGVVWLRCWACWLLLGYCLWREGIAGYTTAMRSYRANEIVNAASSLYVMGLAKEVSTGITSATYVSMGGTNPTGVSEIAYNNGAISITFTDTDLQQLVQNKLGDKAGEYSEGIMVVNFGEVVATTPTCESGQGWNGTACVPIAQLYEKGSQNWYANLSDSDCPTNYHLATYDEYFQEFNCQAASDPYILYSCDSNSLIGAVKDNNGNFYETYNGEIGRIIDAGAYDALCRHN